MSHHPYDARYVLRAVTGLDFGLRVRIQGRAQRTIFTGADALSVERLTSELAEMISSLRVYSYPLRGELERITTALQHNVEQGSWRFARRAALDLSGVLAQAGKHGVGQPRPLLARGQRGPAHRGPVRPGGGALMALHLIPGIVPAEPSGSAVPSGPVTAASAAVAATASDVPAEAAAGLAAVPTDAELDGVVLDASKLHVYQVALELHTQCSVLVAVLHRVVCDQLERASLSILLNTAEAIVPHCLRLFDSHEKRGDWAR